MEVNMTVHVAIPALGKPDMYITTAHLDAHELVKFTIGQGGSSFKPNVLPIGGCNYVQDYILDVPVAVSYQIASEFQDAIDKAKARTDKATANATIQILRRIKFHAVTHYNRVATKVIPLWQSDAAKDLDSTLPTKKTPTSLTDVEIQERAGPLVSYWVDELVYRMAKDVNDWEAADYPELDKFIRSFPGGWSNL